MTDKGSASRAGRGGKPTLGDDLTAKRVAEYLRNHPDFLIDHPGLLEVMNTPGQRLAM